MVILSFSSNRTTTKTTKSCDRLQNIDSALDTPTSGDLAFLLRRLHEVRGRDLAEYQQLVHKILERESRTVKLKVAAAGASKSGSAWVSRTAIDDVVSNALHRISRFLSEMEGHSVGEFRTAVNTCVRYAVADHVRADQRDKQAVPIDPGHFTDALPPEQRQYAEVCGMAAEGGAEDRANFKERLETIVELEPRAADVLILRLHEGRPSKEVAELLGLTPANVDQIVSRSVAKLRELGK